MSDLNMPPGMPPGGGAPAGRDVAGKLNQMQSVFNPADIAAMVQRGEITPETPFRDVLAKMGISPEDTVAQVIEKVMQERNKANPLEKMRALSTGAGGIQPPGAGMPQPGAGPSAPPEMSELFGVT
jgi:hypothetical protein